MSVYKNEARMRAWACERLCKILDRDRYPVLFAGIDAAKKKDRLTLPQLGLLRLMLDSQWRPDRDEKTQERYGTSAYLGKPEIAEVLGVSTRTVGKAREAINKMVRKGALDGDEVSSKLGLILFSDFGYCYRPNLGDTDLARNHSRKQINGQNEAHAINIGIADEKDDESNRDREHRARFDALTPSQRERLMAQVS